MYKETYINGVKQSEEPIPYSLLEQKADIPLYLLPHIPILGEELGRLKNLEIL